MNYPPNTLTVYFPTNWDYFPRIDDWIKARLVLNEEWVIIFFTKKQEEQFRHHLTNMIYGCEPTNN